MKLLKIAAAVFACVIIVFGALVFYGAYMGRHLLEKDVGELLVREIKIEESLDQMLSDLYLPAGIRSQLVDQVREKKQVLMNHEEFNSFLDKYSSALLRSIVDDTAEMPDINGDFHEMIDRHGKEITSVFDGFLNESFQQMMLDEIKEGLDLRPVYQLIVSSVQEQLTAQQADLLFLVNTLCQPAFKMVGILSMAGGFIALLLLYPPVLWLLLSGLSMVVAGAGMLAGKLYAAQLTATLAIADDVFQEFIHAELERLLMFGLSYFTLGMILALLWCLVHTLGRKQQR